MQVFLEEFILHTLEGRDAQCAYYDISPEAMHKQCDQGVGGNVEEDESTHHHTVVVVVVDMHGQCNTNGAFQSTEGQYDDLPPHHSFTQFSQVFYEYSDREEARE